MGASKVYTLDANGILYPCNLSHGIEWFIQTHGFDFLMENCNIKKSKFNEIYTHNVYLQFYQHVRHHDLNIRNNIQGSICESCEVNEYCQIVCPLEKRINPVNPICGIAISHFNKI